MIKKIQVVIFLNSIYNKKAGRTGNEVGEENDESDRFDAVYQMGRWEAAAFDADQGADAGALQTVLRTVCRRRRGDI